MTHIVNIDKTCKITAKVGRDTIENAEYIMFEHINICDEDRPLKDKIEDFWLTITCPFRRLKYSIKDAYWKICYGFQRMFKGYDSVDTFETYEKFIDRYSKIITELKDNHVGCPCDLSDEEWNAVLYDMIYHLYYMKEINVTNELESYVSDEWTPSMKTVGEIMEMHKNEFFKLFSEYFYSLWD